MEINKIDSDTIVIDGVMFTRSDHTGKYLTSSLLSTDKHVEAVELYEQGEREDNKKSYEQSLAGIFINLN